VSLNSVIHWASSLPRTGVGVARAVKKGVGGTGLVVVVQRVVEEVTATWEIHAIP
jgi:hypothetical protein